MNIIISNHLPIGAVLVRRDVFIKEQGFVYEYDEIDDFATHCVIYINSKPVATGRLFYQNEFHIGRVAVLKDYRNLNLGSKIMLTLETEAKKLGGSYIGLSAQLRASSFYKKIGYNPIGEPYYDEHVLHIKMIKEI